VTRLSRAFHRFSFDIVEDVVEDRRRFP